MGVGIERKLWLADATAATDDFWSSNELDAEHDSELGDATNNFDATTGPTQSRAQVLEGNVATQTRTRSMRLASWLIDIGGHYASNNILRFRRCEGNVSSFLGERFPRK